MEKVKVYLLLHLYHYAVGKTGNDHVCARFVVRRSDDANLLVHILRASSPAKIS